MVALALLAVFALLGTAYVQYMALENARTRADLVEIHARMAAERAIWTAVAQARAALDAGVAPALESAELTLPLYRRVTDGDLELDDRYQARVKIDLSDESGRVNLNCAPIRVLQAMLGVDGDTARALKRALPREGERATPDRRWLADLSDPGARGLVPPQVQARIADELAPFLTVYSVSEPGDAAAHINVNTAPQEVLAAVLNPDAAERVVKARAARPLDSMAELLAATESGVEAFNVRAPEAEPGQAPRELTFRPRSLRIAAEARVEPAGGSRGGARRRIEAVAVFEDDGRISFTRWVEVPGEESW